MENIAHMADEVSKKVGTSCLPPGVKRDKEVKPKIWQEEIQRYVGSRKGKKEEDEALNPFSISEKDHDPLSSSSGQQEEEIPEVECKSLQGDCMGEEREDECTYKLFMDDLQIIAKDVGSCKGGATYFGSDPKEVHK